MGIGFIFTSSQGFPNDVRSASLDKLLDSEIAERISKKLFNSKIFSQQDIHITVKSGTVTLSGYVSSLRSKDRAVQFAEGSRGVTAVIDELSLKAPPRSDELIQKDVKRFLSLDSAIRPFNLATSVSKGVVTLKGIVDSWAAKNLAAWVAAGVRGVVEVDSDIKIIPQRKVSEKEIADEVKGELKADPYINDKLIQVNVEGSRVTLSGKVSSLQQRSRAYRDAFVASVMDVDASEIKIDPQLQNLGPAAKIPEDAVQIQTAATRAMRLDPRLKGGDIYVDVNGHSATLSGTVENLKSKLTAEDDVRNTLGVVEVNDQLFVDSGQNRSDPDIAADVKDVMALDSLLDPFPITASVKNGVVTLSGKVDTDYEKWDASEEVSVIDGVKGIQNDLGLYQPAQKREYVTDASIREAISQDLRDDDNLNLGDQVKVSVKAGKATLSGTVLTWHDSFEAVEDAFMGGAIGVSNEIKTAGQKTPNIRWYPSVPREAFTYQWRPVDVNISPLKDQTSVSLIQKVKPVKIK
jgi:osmotically-inducible protein OsmY